MKSVFMDAPRSVSVRERPLPTPGGEDVLIKVHAVGLCGTDLHSYRGLGDLAIFPLVPGHELGGEVARVGSAVPAGLFSPGQAVTVKPYFNCGACYPCRIGRVNCCKNSKTMGVQKPEGALSEYVAVPYRNVIPCDGLSYPLIALIEPLCIGEHLVSRTQVQSGESVLVLGCGMIGLGAIAACRKRGAAVIAADVADNKLALAKSVGASFTVNTQTENLGERLRACFGEPVKVAIEAIGLPATMLQAVQAVDYGGRVGFVGYGSGELKLNSNEMIRKELTVACSRNALRDDFFHVRDNMLSGGLPYETLISAAYPADRAAEAFADWDAAPDRFTKIQIGFD